MDDQKFDDIIRGKLDGYEDPSFDPAAMAGFHEKLAGFRAAPWYEHPLSHYLMAASLTLFTAVNAYIFWPTPHEKQAAALPVKAHELVVIDSLSEVIHQLRTTYSIVTQQRDSAVRLTLSSPSIRTTLASSNQRKASLGLNLGKTSDVPTDVYRALLVKKMIVDENGESYLVTPEKSWGLYDYRAELSVKNVGEEYPWPQVEAPSFMLTSKPTVLAEEAKSRRNTVSNKMRTVLEKHYSKGIGINVAPVVDLAKGTFSTGVGGLNPRVGVMADWVLSPSVSIETGLAYSTTTVRTDNNFQNLDLPAPDPSLGIVETVQIKNFLASAPVAIKYRRWISEKGQAFLRAGYTPYFSFAQEYEFMYDFDRGVRPPPGQGPDPDHHRVNSIQKVNTQGFYGGTGTVSLGLTKLVKNNNRIEASLFYEKSLASVGREQLDMQLFGVRTAFWFNLR